MSGKKPPAKTKPPSPPGPPWQVILEEIQSQNRVAMDAVQAHHEEARRELQNFRGEVFVVAAAEQFKLLKTIPMGDEGDDRLRASVAAAQGDLFIRTGHKLYCVGGSETLSAK